MEFVKQFTFGTIYFMISILPVFFYVCLYIYYRPQLKRKMDDSTVIYLVLLLPLFILLVGINDWAFEYGSELDRGGIIAIGIIGMIIFSLCFMVQKGKEDLLNNKTPKESKE